MNNINKRIRESRPHLSKVSPLVYRISQGFVAMNFLLGLVLLQVAGRTTDELPLFGNLITFETWALVYFALSTSLALGLYRNNWKLTKATLIAGLFLKTFWTLCLAVLAIQGHSLFDIAILWLFIAWAQGWCVVHFLPVISWGGVDERTGGQTEEQ